MATLLRPFFTQRIFEDMNNGRSFNVFSTDDRSLKRLVDDLDELLPQDAAQLVRISMKSYAHDHAAFVAQLCQQLRLPTDSTTSAGVGAVIAQAADRPNAKTVWFVIENFDALTHPPADSATVDKAGYNRNFLDHLNGLKNHQNVRLLVTSAKKIATQELYVGGESVAGSRLEFSQHRAMPNMTETEIKAEVERRVTPFPTNFWEKDAGKYLCRTIIRHAKPLYFLEHAAMQPFDLATEPTIKSWEKQFEKENQPSVDLRLTRMDESLGKFSYRTKRILNMVLQLGIIKAKWWQIILLVIALLGGVARWKQPAQWVQNLFH